MLHHVKKEYGVEYHENYAYELLRKTGLSLRTARPQHYEADPEEKAVVVVDQFTKHVGTVQRRGWYPIDSNPTIETAASWKSVTVLGAVTDDGDSFYCWTEENLTRFHEIRLLEGLTDKFGEN